MAVCSVIAKNYAAMAEVLGHSLKEITGITLKCLVIDAEKNGDFEAIHFEPIYLEDLPIARDDLYSMLAAYNVMEFSTAIKAWVIRHLGQLEGFPVTYLDPDICIYHAFEDLLSPGRGVHVVLTPHVLKPVPRDGRRPSPEELAFSGVFNLGFITVTEEGVDFLEFWMARLRRYCVVDKERNLFVDQKFCDLAPIFFKAQISRRPQHNVAYWNVHERPLTFRRGSFFVEDEPLTFFHFSGYDPEVPWRLSKHQGDSPRVELLECPDLFRLTFDYRERLLAAGHLTLTKQPYGYDTAPSGIRLDPFMRKAYWRALIDAEEKGDELPPNPFTEDKERFLEFLATPAARAGRDKGIGRYLYEVWLARPDLQAAFPEPFGADARGFREWASSSGIAEGLAPEALF